MNYSENYKLNKPQRNEQFNLDHWNENTDKIDSAMNTNKTNIANNASNISTILTGLSTVNTGDTNSVYYKLMKLIYPVGSIYWSSRSTNPGTLFGGTWTQIKDKFVLACGDTYKTTGATGGASTVTLSISNMPSHTHTFTPKGTISAHSHTTSSHTHSFTPSGSVSSTFAGTTGTTGSTAPTFTGKEETVNVTGGNHRHEVVHDGTKGDEPDVFECYNGMSYYYRGAYTQYSGNLSMSGRFTPSGSVSSHTHSFTSSGSVSSTFAGTTGTTGSGGGSDTGSTAPTFTGTSGTTSSNGSGTSFSIMPPYIVKYCWERTA